MCQEQARPGSPPLTAMHTLYDSDAYAVMQFDLPSSTPHARAPGSPGAPDGGNTAASEPATTTASTPEPGTLAALLQHPGGFEIVDKHAGRDRWLDGDLARRFLEGALALAGSEPDTDDVDAYIDGFCGLHGHPLVLH